MYIVSHMNKNHKTEKEKLIQLHIVASQSKQLTIAK